MDWNRDEGQDQREMGQGNLTDDELDAMKARKMPTASLNLDSVQRVSPPENGPTIA